MRLTARQFHDWKHKSITLLGMSGVGKTWLSMLLRRQDWFHYSGDYRIGTRYLDEPILDNVKQQAMQVPFLRELLRADSIRFSKNLTVDNLHLVLSYLGKVGNPEAGGLSLREFKRRQRQFREAEITAMLDVPDFIHKAQEIYGYRHFVNDAGGSLCELEHPAMFDVLAEHTLILYIKATERDVQTVIQRAEQAPKPLYYREDFLDEQLARYMDEHQLPYAALIDPDAFVRWVFPHLFRSRLPRYESIAAQYGYTVGSEEIAAVRNEAEFLALIERTLSNQTQPDR
jgi:hypothetical protein